MAILGTVGVAVEILDGKLRAATMTALTLLERAALVDPMQAAAVIAATTPAITGRGGVVGRIRTGAGLN